MPTANGDRLEYGLDGAVPPDTLTAWGARLIVTQDGHVDLVPDRQGCAGVERDNILVLLKQHLPPSALMQRIGDLLRSGEMDTRQSRLFTVLSNDNVTVVADTKASAGYCYVAAWPQNIATYDGTDTDAMIFGHTDPWIEVDGKPVEWTPDMPRVSCGCDPDIQVVLPGVLEGMNTPCGVQRCDACETFDGDLDAALALARHVGGVVKYHSAKE